MRRKHGALCPRTHSQRQTHCRPWRRQGSDTVRLAPEPSLRCPHKPLWLPVTPEVLLAVKASVSPGDMLARRGRGAAGQLHCVP